MEQPLKNVVHALRVANVTEKQAPVFVEVLHARRKLPLQRPKAEQAAKKVVALAVQGEVPAAYQVPWAQLALVYMVARMMYRLQLQQLLLLMTAAAMSKKRKL